MREMLADVGSKFFVEVVYQKCTKVWIVCLSRMHAIISAQQCTTVQSDVDDLWASKQIGFQGN